MVEAEPKKASDEAGTDHDRPGHLPGWAWFSVALGLAVVVLIGAVVFLTWPREGGGALALGFREGERSRYRVSMVFDGYEQIGSKKRPIDGQITELVSHTVTSVASDGSAVIEVAVEKIRGSVGPERAINLERAGTPTVRMVVAPDGRLLQVEGVLAAFVGQIRAADADPMKVWSDPVGGGGVDGMQPFPLLPDQPVGPGDEWETDFQLPLGIGRHVIDVHTESRLLRYERIDGVRTAVIKARAEYPIDVAIDWSLFAREYGGSPVPYEDLDRLPSTLSYTGTTGWVQTTWLDPELGRLVRARGSAEFDVTAEFEGGGPRIRRLLAEKASLHVVGGMKIAVRRVAP